jgi:hypothetical protein
VRQGRREVCWIDSIKSKPCSAQVPVGEKT